MPKNTFLKLNEEKKTRIINAAKKEFTRVPLHKVSINNIVKDAMIPRGSFYQYFDCVEDLYYYIYDMVVIDMESETNSFLEEVEYDIFDIFKESIKRQYSIYMNESRMALYNNLCDGVDENKEWRILRDQKYKERDQFFLHIINRDNLTDDSDEAVLFLIGFLRKIKVIVISEARKNDLSLKEVVELYEKYIRIIKKGATKK